MVLAACTPLGSPSIRMQSLFLVSGGMIMDVPVSVLIRLTGCVVVVVVVVREGEGEGGGGGKGGGGK